MNQKLKDKIGFALTSLMVLVYIATLIWYMIFLERKADRSVIYDCSLAEISPDFPVEVKNECRKKRGRV